MQKSWAAKPYHLNERSAVNLTTKEKKEMMSTYRERFCPYCSKYKEDIGFTKIVSGKGIRYKCEQCVEISTERDKQIKESK
jgi:hypothetical protein